MERTWGRTMYLDQSRKQTNSKNTLSRVRNQTGQNWRKARPLTNASTLLSPRRQHRSHRSTHTALMAATTPLSSLRQHCGISWFKVAVAYNRSLFLALCSRCRWLRVATDQVERMGWMWRQNDDVKWLQNGNWSIETRGLNATWAPYYLVNFKKCLIAIDLSSNYVLLLFC